MPKSSSLGIRPPPRSITITFEGFRSRWMIPRSCAAAHDPRDAVEERHELFGRHRAALDEPRVERDPWHELHGDPQDAAAFSTIPLRPSHLATPRKLGDRSVGVRSIMPLALFESIDARGGQILRVQRKRR
jgi:hypothetical protein